MVVRVQVPASTANLGPGFDCIGMAIKLFNTVEMTETCSGLSIDVSGEGQDSGISRDSSNIVYRAARQVFDKAGYSPAGLKIRLVNKIPVSRGLGSSAAAIVGGVVAANTICGGVLSNNWLLKIATEMEGHPDNVTPALLGGITVYAHSEGEIHYLKIEPPSGVKAVLVIPDYPLSTSVARDMLPKRFSREDAVFNIRRTALLIAALQKGDLEVLGVAMEDKLHQFYREGLIPGMKKVFAAAKLAGARGVAVSGAGPSLIALTDRNEVEIARVMKDTFYQCGVKSSTSVLELCPVGATALEIK